MKSWEGWGQEIIEVLQGKMDWGDGTPGSRFPRMVPVSNIQTGVSLYLSYQMCRSVVLKIWSLSTQGV